MLWRDLLTIRSVKLPASSQQPESSRTVRLPPGVFFLKEGATDSHWAFCDTPAEVAESERRYERLVKVWDSAVKAIGQAPLQNSSFELDRRA